MFLFVFFPFDKLVCRDRMLNYLFIIGILVILISRKFQRVNKLFEEIEVYALLLLSPDRRLVNLIIKLILLTSFESMETTSIGPNCLSKREYLLFKPFSMVSQLHCQRQAMHHDMTTRLHHFQFKIVVVECKCDLTTLACPNHGMRLHVAHENASNSAKNILFTPKKEKWQSNNNKNRKQKKITFIIHHSWTHFEQRKARDTGCDRFEQRFLFNWWTDGARTALDSDAMRCSYMPAPAVASRCLIYILSMLICGNNEISADEAMCIALVFRPIPTQCTAVVQW